MSLNPQLNEAKDLPKKQNELNEQLICTREPIAFEITLGDKLGSFKGRGVIILTSRRIVLINKKKEKKDPFEAFEFPIHKITKEQLQQPIFGSNYLHAFCKPKHPEKFPKGTRIQLKAYF